MGGHYGISFASVRVVFFVWWHRSSVKNTTSDLALAVEDAAEEQWYADRGNSEIHPSSDLVADDVSVLPA